MSNDKSAKSVKATGKNGRNGGVAKAKVSARSKTKPAGTRTGKAAKKVIDTATLPDAFAANDSIDAKGRSAHELHLEAERIEAATRPHPRHTLSVRGATLHTLKNVSLDLPRNRLIVFSGPSGSGKSTLAFDTIYAEGQRRYVESLSAYARQFLSRMAKPLVESISGLAPAVAIQQQTLQRNPRSTVATTTEIYDYLRLLYGRIGTTICRNCGAEVKRDSPRTVQDSLADLAEGTRVYLLFPIPDHPTRSLAEEIEALRARGFFRIVPREGSEIIDMTDDRNLKELKKKSKDDFSVLVDRIIMRDDDTIRTRIAEAAESAFREGGGRIEARVLETMEQRSFSTRFECAGCGTRWQEPEPRLFSFNNPFGACPECQGFGRAIGIDHDLVIPDRSKSIKQGAIAAFGTPKHSQHYRELLAIARSAGVDVDAPIGSLSEEATAVVMDGYDGYIGINGFFSMIEKNTHKMHYRVFLSRYRGYTTCPKCKGSRLRASAMQVFVDGSRIHELTAKSIEKVVEWFDRFTPDPYQEQIAGRILDEIKKRLNFLNQVGLGYLRLDRLSHSLSGGEMQRINLATSIGSALVGAMYVLDEPSIGLHPRDTGRLISILLELRDLGNTVIVVEHDPDIIRAADVVVDMGPLAGEKGGEVVFVGTVEEMLAAKSSPTGSWLSGRTDLAVPKRRREPRGQITLNHATLHNLVDVSVAFPLHVLTVVTGVSGSGKSTLVHDLLYPILSYRLGRGGGKPVVGLELEGLDMIDSVEMIDQTPIGRTPRSNPATYTKAFDAVRDLFAMTSYARLNGWKAGYFSFNVPGGRCEVCEGEGSVTVDMQFLADIQIPCDACKGTRYKSEVLNARYNGKSVVDVLEMTVDEGVGFFAGQSRITKRLQSLSDVGLGYVRLGQPATTLSGGEAQRVKLATSLISPPGGHTLFILDEPTTGLHVSDVAVLLKAFTALIDKGHSVIVIEHNLDIIKSADHVIDLGPEGGDRGGRVVAFGTPEEIVRSEESLTGHHLSPLLR